MAKQTSVNSWKEDLLQWALHFAHRFQDDENVVGIMIGGSIARGQQWKHSDLELGLVVKEKIDSLPYFNIDAGRGVEIIQLRASELQAQLTKIEAGEVEPIAQWPIQLWRCKIVKDREGMVAAFKKNFDEKLFSNAVVDQKIQMLRGQIDQELVTVHQLLADNRPKAALVYLRKAMNNLLLHFYWRHRILPRSQNRTESRLRAASRKCGDPEIYALYHAIFHLQDTNQVIRTLYPQIREEVLDYTAKWGQSTRDFFAIAVDGDFQWGNNKGILTVYRLYVPVIGELTEQVDDPGWMADHDHLLAFLGLKAADCANVTEFVKRMESYLASGYSL